jgi:L-threonylcarbamoyladenylate synthase
MEIISIRERRSLPRAREVLERGGVIIFPTDTVYGIGGDALRRSVLTRIRRMKERERQKPFPWLVSDVRMAERYGVFTPSAQGLAKRFWPGAVTIVVRRRGSKRATIGLRVPAHPWLHRLIAAFGRPIIGTSANRSGKRPATTARAARRIFPDADLIIDGGLCDRKPSRVLDCRFGGVSILRR